MVMFLLNQLSMISVITLLLALSSSILVQGQEECPLPQEDPTRPCAVINSWDDLVIVVRLARSSELNLICPFDIQMPDYSQPLILAKPVTFVCAEAGRCSIRAAKKQNGSIMKMKGLAQVTLYGFIFLSNGAGTFDRSSAVHITFATTLTQTFCSCIFDGFKGKMRGTALRSEYKSSVNLIDCNFTNNAPNDLGTVFNRGLMNIKGCTFNNNFGRGGAIGSSRGSLTILKQNSFIGNKVSVPVYFHDEDYIDLGGNSATNNGSCDGIFVEKGSQCLLFNADQLRSSSPVTKPVVQNTPSVPSARPSSMAPSAHGSCQNFETKGHSSCVSVSSFDELKTHVQESHGTLIFCPFKITKTSSERLDINVRIQMICLVAAECEINGKGRHIIIKGPSAEVSIQGFVFKHANIAAVHVLPNTPKSQCLLQSHFLWNQGGGRGVGILAERNTKVHVNSCHFRKNKSNDLGGSVFNRGEMIITNSSFEENEGRGSAIGNAPHVPLTMRNNTFERNSMGYPVFIHDYSFVDLGGNVAEDNSECDGVWIDRGQRSCTAFRNDQPPANRPTSFPSEITTATIGGVGYFNYNKSDLVYGPNGGWGDVSGNAEYLRYKELSETLKRSLRNKCDWKNVNQSPIDLCENKINNECYEYHQTRSHSGNINLGDAQVTAQILSSKLRLKYYPDRPPADGPYPPELDFANNWNGYAEVNHVDIKIPSEHTICGKQYPAEYSIYVLHPDRRQTIVMSILLTYHDDDEDNEHLQLAIDEWQKEYDRNAIRCNATNNYQRILQSELQNTHSQILKNTSIPTTDTKQERDLADETPFGTGGWDPFHPSLERSIYHWGYYGSLTEPPCSTFVAWRVLTEPAYISKRQLNQMKHILFTNRDDRCNYTSVNFEESVARPTQPNRGRLIHKCTVEDYVSDEEKAAMREKTGNPNWCC